MVGKSVHAVFADPQRPGGLEMVYGPEDLRFCQAHFMPLR